MMIRPAEKIVRKTGARYVIVRAGCVVRVTLITFDDGLAIWSLKEPIHYAVIKPGGAVESGYIVGIADKFLMPIRPAKKEGTEGRSMMRPVKKLMEFFT